MMIEKIIEKWGNLKHVGHYYENGKMLFISKEARLNVLFDPCSETEIIIQEKLQCNLPSELSNFYKLYNGCRLFFGSLCVYGIQNYPEDVYEPYDIIYENAKYVGSDVLAMKMIVCGSLGGDYLVCFDREERKKIYCIDAENHCVLKVFDDFNVFFEYYFNKLFDEYDEQCKKIHPNKEFQGIPVLENITAEV